MTDQPADQSGDRLADRFWPSLEAGRTWLLVPVGSLEQHGPHLPLRTDTIVAEAVASSAARRLASAGVTVTVGPPVEYGASGEHQDFPGTVSLGLEALRTLLLELGRSAMCWAERLVFVNGHGGNLEALSAAVGDLRREGRQVGWTSCGVPGADAHAGDAETSLLLHLAPHLVGGGRVPGETRPVAELVGSLRRHGVRAVSATGVLGDPTTATAQRGAALLETIVGRVAGEVTRMTADDRGRLR